MRSSPLVAIIVSLLVGCGYPAAAMDLDDPAEPWLTARAGVSTDVPPPFEPLQLEGHVVRLWGRRYDLGGIFPRHIENQGEEMLAGPIELIVGLDGQETHVDEAATKFGAVRQDRIEYSATTTVGPLQVSASNWVEYDGVVQVNLTLQTDKEVTVERLTIQIPLRVVHARYFHQSARWGTSLYEAVGAEDDWRWASKWWPYIWLGDDDRGLAFVTESQAGWTGPEEEALELFRDGDRVVFHANVINEPTPLNGERTFTFGLHATPSKPLPPDWHGRHCGPAAADAVERYSTNVCCIWFSQTKWYSYPQPDDPEQFRETIEGLHADGVRAVVYISTAATGPESEVFRRHREEWLMTDGDKPLFGSESVEGRGKGMVSVCPASTFADWIVWGVERLIEEYDVDGVYIDNASPYYCNNTKHGCARGGETTYPYFAARELQKRLWVVVKRHKPDGLVWEHTSRESNSMNLAFVDIYSDGEQFRNPKNDPIAISLDNITPTFLAITATGRQWGAQPCFLPSAINTREEITDWLLARLLPYGNVLWAAPRWMDFSRLHPVLRARWAFGLGRERVEWFTPDRVPTWLQVRPEELLVGGYIRKDRRVLVTISNVSDTHMDARIRVAELQGYLGVSPKVEDATTGSRCYWKGPEAWLTIPSNSFRVLLISPESEQD